ncbi:MAG: glycosyltransferase family 87 protein [Chloroherpetonaceae bacterium]|nr:glycosyltransferase family 87 protein [Chloroherpetonaceae bacterium]
MHFWKNFYVLFATYTLLTIGASLQKYVLSLSEGEASRRHFNNYAIFKSSAKHLLEGRNLYVPHPEDHDDFYKYSPTFAVLMLPFLWLPEAVGLAVWNLLNALTLFIALWLLPLSQEKRAQMLWLLLPELLINIQNSQSNGLVAACMVLAFVAIEKEKMQWAMLASVLSGFVKVFGIVSALFAVFSKEKIKAVWYGVVWAVGLAITPLCVTSLENLLSQYRHWIEFVRGDLAPGTSASIFGWWQAWWGSEPPRAYLMMLGVGLLVLPLVQIEKYRLASFRLTYLAHLLIWSVIFNPRAESPSFVIAMSGIVIWFVIQRKGILDWLLFLNALFLASILPSDLTPNAWTEFGWRFKLKAFGVMLVWAKVLYDLFADSLQEERLQTAS